MRRLLIITSVLVAVAVAEVAVIIAIARTVGIAWTILLVLATSALGGWLLRREGSRAWRAFRADLAANRPPGNAATDGLLVFLGGTLMLIPGFVTAIGGALLLVPPARRVARAALMYGVGRRLSPSTATSLFGPRRVRVRYGRPRHSEPARRGEPTGSTSYGSAPYGATPSGDTSYGASSHGGSPYRASTGGDRDTILGGEPIEGEIIDPR